jgi:hypothetical protein
MSKIDRRTFLVLGAGAAALIGGWEAPGPPEPSALFPSA